MQRIIFVGTDAPLQKTLRQLETFENLEVVAVYTEPKRNLEVDRLCEKHDLLTRDIESLAKHSDSQRSDLECDWLFCVNSTIILPPSVLRAPRCGALNMHPGRLPDYAGLHTHQWAIRNGEQRFGATVHWIEASVDTGAIAYSSEFAISDKETGLSLFVKCLNSGTDLVSQALHDIDQHNPIPKRPQDLSERKLYRHRDAMNGNINWSQTARQIERFVRAADYGPLRCPTYFPSTFTSCGSLSVKKTVLLELECEQPPGTVVQMSSEGIDVACGSNTSLRILTASLNGKTFKPRDLPTIGFQTGERWGNVSPDKMKSES